PFRVSGKQILKAGWRDVFAKDKEKSDEEEERKDDEERTLPAFEKGESGPQRPGLAQKMTQPPKPYTEATLLRAMETAGRTVEDEELRDAMNENGIGRPSTRAAIIETLFRRNYIRKNRKTLYATPTGVELIAIIKEDLLKSAELTGRWEKKLRQIEHHEYSSAQFVEEMKQMIGDIVQQVMTDTSNRKVSQSIQSSHQAPHPSPQGGKQQGTKGATRIRAGMKCPVCGEGKVIKGHTAYGCSRWKEGCTFRHPFTKK
ncbi:MAG: DNA topoisomerase III, partial [Alloprevotella sp.]|nr:DNA topoisomerase III [Alloprevotella sp.]